MWWRNAGVKSASAWHWPPGEPTSSRWWSGSTALVAAGAVVGMAAAAASSRVLESLLHGVSVDDRLTFLGAPLVLVAVALVACYLPARRATRIDPMETLRCE